MDSQEDRELTFIASGKTEGGDGSDDSKNVVGENGEDLALGRVRLEERKTRATGGHDLLLLGARELADDGLGHGRGRLDRQRVHEHVGCGRHLD